MLGDLVRELWQRALAAAALELKHGAGARELTSRAAEAQALREQLQGLRQQLEAESLAYGELRTLAARHEAIARDALSQVTQAATRERKLLHDLGQARQALTELTAQLHVRQTKRNPPRARPAPKRPGTLRRPNPTVRSRPNCHRQVVLP